MLNNALQNQYSDTGETRSGLVTVPSSTNGSSIFSTTATEDGVYKIKTTVIFKCKNCDVSVSIYINNKMINQQQCRACSTYSTVLSFNEIVNVKKGDVVNIKAGQYSGADSNVEYYYDYFR